MNRKTKSTKPKAKAAISAASRADEFAYSNRDRKRIHKTISSLEYANQHLAYFVKVVEELITSASPADKAKVANAKVCLRYLKQASKRLTILMADLDTIWPIHTV
jgi:hypothetical protein